MKPGHIVIVGGGVAGHRCAMELRRCGFEGALTLVGAEAHPPYNRTLLSKDFLQATIEASSLALVSRAEYEDLEIELRLGLAAAALSPRAHVLTLADGTTIPYDRLVIATGGTPARPAALCDSAGYVLRSLDDAVALRAVLSACSKLVVIGGGFVGAEVASAGRSFGIEVTVVEALAAPLARVLGAEVGHRITDLHRGHGVEVLTATSARAIRRVDHTHFDVQMADGRVCCADAVLVGAGMAAATTWLASSGIEHEGAVIVDELCGTSAPDVLAAGDCTRWFHPGYGELVHVEHWDTAGRHGAAAARAAIGEGEPFAPLPFFWSFQHGVRLQWVGQPTGWDSVEIQDQDPPHSFVARYRRDQRLVGAFAANGPHAIAAAREELKASTEVLV